MLTIAQTVRLLLVTLLGQAGAIFWSARSAYPRPVGVVGPGRYVGAGPVLLPFLLVVLQADADITASVAAIFLLLLGFAGCGYLRDIWRVRRRVLFPYYVLLAGISYVCGLRVEHSWPVLECFLSVLWPLLVIYAMQLAATVFEMPFLLALVSGLTCLLFFPTQTTTAPWAMILSVPFVLVSAVPLLFAIFRDQRLLLGHAGWSALGWWLAAISLLGRSKTLLLFGLLFPVSILVLPFLLICILLVTSFFGNELFSCGQSTTAPVTPTTPATSAPPEPPATVLTTAASALPELPVASATPAASAPPELPTSSDLLATTEVADTPDCLENWNAAGDDGTRIRLGRFLWRLQRSSIVSLVGLVFLSLNFLGLLLVVQAAWYGYFALLVLMYAIMSSFWSSFAWIRPDGVTVPQAGERIHVMGLPVDAVDSHIVGVRVRRWWQNNEHSSERSAERRNADGHDERGSSHNDRHSNEHAVIISVKHTDRQDGGQRPGQPALQPARQDVLQPARQDVLQPARQDARQDTNQRLYHILTADSLALERGLRNKEFRATLARADLVTPDGAGLIWAADFLGTPLPARVPGVALLIELCAWARDDGISLYFVGGKPEVLREATSHLQEKFSGLQIAGSHHGFFAPGSAEEDALLAAIAGSGARLIPVAMGVPRQERFIERLRATPGVQGVAIGVGGSLDVISGRIPRAPAWMQKFALEWLFRLWLEPSRLLRMRRIPLFVLAVLRHKWRRSSA